MTHVEMSTDADSWEQRRQRFGKKFADAAKYYPELFQFVYQRVEKVAIVEWGRTVPSGTSFEHGWLLRQYQSLSLKSRRFSAGEAL
jgi:hypothetical protein